LDVKKRFSEEQIIGFLREAEAGMPVKELCRKHGFSEASYYLWRSKFGGMSVPDAKRLKELETENGKNRMEATRSLPSISSDYMALIPDFIFLSNVSSATKEMSQDWSSSPIKI
jgi:putative transposase